MKFRFAPAAVLAIAVGFVAATKAEALSVVPATLSFNYTGTVSTITDPSNLTGLGIGSTISGTVTFDPLNDVYTTSSIIIGPITLGTTNSFAETGKFTFGTPGNETEVGGISGTVDSSLGGFILTGTSLGFTFANNGGDSLSLAFNAFPAFSFPLTSLTQLPADSTGIAQLLGGFITTGTGHINFLNSQIDFDVDVGTYTPPTPTPLPASAWFFMSSIAGLGVLGWKRRHAIAG